MSLSMYVDISDYGWPNTERETYDSARFQSALDVADAEKKYLYVPYQDDPYLVAGLTSTGGCKGIYSNGATLKLPDSTITNTDADYDNFTPILQVQGCTSFKMEGVIFDGNKANQTIPATQNNFGRGTSNARRTNGTVEFVPSADNTTPSKNIHIKRCEFKDGYMSGCMFWQCENVLVRGNKTSNNRINGFGGAAFDGFVFKNNRSYRDGYDADYTTSRYEGDRGQIQIRELPHSLTSASLGIPMISISATGFSKGVVINNNYAEENNTISIFARGCFDATVEGNHILNHGYKRLTGASYEPCAIWVEWGQFTVKGNMIHLQQNLSGDMKSEGIRCFPLVGDGTSTFNADGVYSGIVEGNTIYSGQVYDTGGAYTSNTYKINNVQKGIFVSQNTMVRGNYVSDTVEEAIGAINDATYSNLPLHDVAIIGNDIKNTTFNAAIYFTKYGTPSGIGGNIKVLNNTIQDIRNSDANRYAIMMDGAWVGYQFNDIQVNGNTLVLSNSATPADTIGGVQLRLNNASTNLTVDNNTFRDGANAFNIGSFGTLSFSNNMIENCNRGSSFGMVANSGIYKACGNVMNNMVTNGFNFVAGGYTVDEFICTDNTFNDQGAGKMFNGITMDTFPTNVIAHHNFDNGTTKVELVRSYTGAPTANALYIGEFIKANTSTTTTRHVAVTTGTGAGDWSAAL